MTRDQVEVAIHGGIPFPVRMADGKACEVRDRQQIAPGRTTAVVLGRHDMPHVLPLPTMTGISYLRPKKRGG